MFFIMKAEISHNDFHSGAGALGKPPIIIRHRENFRRVSNVKFRLGLKAFVGGL